MRWNSSVWVGPPGEALTWVVAGDPRWTREWTDSEGATRQPPLASPDQVIPFVSEALRAWSDMESADIRWEVSGVNANLDQVGRGDRRSTILVDPGAERGSYAGIWFHRSAGGEWELVDCDVPLVPFAAAELPIEPWWTYALIHEFIALRGAARRRYAAGAGKASRYVRRTVVHVPRR